MKLRKFICMHIFACCILNAPVQDSVRVDVAGLPMSEIWPFIDKPSRLKLVLCPVLDLFECIKAYPEFLMFME